MWAPSFIGALVFAVCGKRACLPFVLSINTAPSKVACALLSASATEVTSVARDNRLETTRSVRSAALHTSCASVMSAVEGAAMMMVSALVRSSSRIASTRSRVSRK